MATFDTNRPTVDGVRFGASSGGFITTLFAKIIAWNDSRVTRNALSALSARELEDIGLSRGDLANM